MDLILLFIGCIFVVWLWYNLTTTQVQVLKEMREYVVNFKSTSQCWERPYLCWFFTRMNFMNTSYRYPYYAVKRKLDQALKITYSEELTSRCSILEESNFAKKYPQLETEHGYSYAIRLRLAWIDEQLEQLKGK